MTVKEAKAADWEEYRTAWTRGYISRKTDIDHQPVKISGTGEMYYLAPSFESTKYCHRWTWIIPDEWAEAHRAEGDYSETHVPLAEAARLAGISRQGMLDKVKSGEIEGLSVPMLSRRRWWVDREALTRWIEARKNKKIAAETPPLFLLY